MLLTVKVPSVRGVDTPEERRRRCCKRCCYCRHQGLLFITWKYPAGPSLRGDLTSTLPSPTTTTLLPGTNPWVSLSSNIFKSFSWIPWKAGRDIYIHHLLTGEAWVWAQHHQGQRLIPAGKGGHNRGGVSPGKRTKIPVPSIIIYHVSTVLWYSPTLYLSLVLALYPPVLTVYLAQIQ